MERFSQRENVLLGCGPPRSFVSTTYSPKSSSSLRNSDVDFSDVFGGPPRRSSVQELRFSFSESPDSHGIRRDDETVVSRDPWSSMTEKPVFGEDSANRRRHRSEDFFDDIFGGEESLSGTPRKPERDVFSISSPSRVLSPARPLPPKAEPFASPTLSVPFSLPAKLAKGMDLPGFASSNRRSRDGTNPGLGSPNSQTASVSRFSESSKNNSRPANRLGLLSQEFALRSKELNQVTECDKMSTDGDLNKDSKSTEGQLDTNQFHFSIYKWAGKRVPLMLPLRGGSRLRVSSSTNGRIESEIVVSLMPAAATLPDPNMSVTDKSFSPETMPSNIELEEKQGGSSQDTITQFECEPYQNIKEVVTAMPESKTNKNLISTIARVPQNHKSGGTSKEKILDSLHEVNSKKEIEKETSTAMQEPCKPELKSLCSLFDENNEPGHAKKTGEKGKASMEKNVKKTLQNADSMKKLMKKGERRVSSDHANAGDFSSPDPLTEPGDKLGKSGVKGRVKDFVKIFNQETFSKSSRWKDKEVSRAENEADIMKAKVEDKVPLSDISTKKTSDASAMADESLKQSKKQLNGNNNYKLFDDSFGQRDCTTSNSESVPDGSEAAYENLDDSFQANFVVKEISEGQSKVLQAGQHREDIQVSDAKIREWSRGKEGNIRSLLSTLQYVLWPESGWKAVALVDIIEGNAVKRTYQRALLCLHPDKLQQKGAATYQKYIAEKVFDILQEAWTEFNSLGSL
ncbi:hypothetical protein RJ641_032298 [Dillenia turbinata]|uniref:J domain-containing protein required for chloroplast accumulation response 1 n=1 Tax=Dillenia turbinata TaxID=194707 RepID=A0AAN8ZLV7_9MAGN